MEGGGGRGWWKYSCIKSYTRISSPLIHSIVSSDSVSGQRRPVDMAWQGLCGTVWFIFFVFFFEFFVFFCR